MQGMAAGLGNAGGGVKNAGGGVGMAVECMEWRLGVGSRL